MLFRDLQRTFGKKTVGTWAKGASKEAQAWALAKGSLAVGKQMKNAFRHARQRTPPHLRGQFIFL